eukprot:TRINITY_DN9981_c0_g1_i2.p1 TRINITY_DN9981_c0_g1~~TRINITY_DN9981_c0_g1_i2.p1  ORF type:complete len:394 (+),score=67.54 TRINITY_DN9981_c0_g1_i2:182-1363(+)
MFSESFDAFAPTDAELRIRTKSGGCISLFALCVMLVLAITEVNIFLSLDVKGRLYVDSSVGHTINIDLNITFHALPCAYISIDAIDKSGRYQLNIRDDIYTVRLGKDGLPVPFSEKTREIVSSNSSLDLSAEVLNPENLTCGSCYGAETPEQPCCRTCDDVRRAYAAMAWAFTEVMHVEQCTQEGLISRLLVQKEEGCNLHGTLHIQRVPGLITIAVEDFLMKNSFFSEFPEKKSDRGGETESDHKVYLNLSHTIEHLSFGQPYPGMKNPLDGVVKIFRDTEMTSHVVYSYFTKVVPTIYRFVDEDDIIDTNQYSVTEYFSSAALVQHPGIYILYELSPITVDFLESYKPFMHFLTNLLAILGGVWTVATLVDSSLYGGLQRLERKAELGKLY